MASGEENGGLPGAHAYKGYAGGVFSLALEAAEAAYQLDRLQRRGKLSDPDGAPRGGHQSLAWAVATMALTKALLRNSDTRRDDLGVTVTAHRDRIGRQHDQLGR